MLAEFRPYYSPMPLGSYPKCSTAYGTVCEDDRRALCDDTLSEMDMGISPIILHQDHPLNLLPAQSSRSAANIGSSIGSSSSRPDYSDDLPAAQRHKTLPKRYCGRDMTTWRGPRCMIKIRKALDEPYIRFKNGDYAVSDMAMWR